MMGWGENNEGDRESNVDEGITALHLRRNNTDSIRMCI